MTRLLAAAVTIAFCNLTNTAFAQELEKAWAAIAEGDREAALSELMPLAERGNPEAQGMIGSVYMFDRFGAPNYAEAYKWLNRAATGGDTAAALNLHELYNLGLENERLGYEEANKDNSSIELQTMFAEFGYAPAQYWLGWRYKNGRGVLQNYSEALFWYRKSIEQGYVKAFSEVGELFLKQGKIVFAHMWFNIAATYQEPLNGKIVVTPGVKNLGFSIIVQRSELEKKMSPEEVSRSQAMGQVCVDSGYKDCEW